VACTKRLEGTAALEEKRAVIERPLKRRNSRKKSRDRGGGGVNGDFRLNLKVSFLEKENTIPDRKNRGAILKNRFFSRYFKKKKTRAKARPWGGRRKEKGVRLHVNGKTRPRESLLK